MKNNNAVAVFISGSKISCDENGLYSLNDLHKASGGEKRHEPNRWLRSVAVKEVIEEMEKSDAHIWVSKKGGKDQGTFVNEILFSMYASWISPKMHIRVYEIFTQAIKERAATLEQENKQLLEFKDESYRRSLLDKHLNSRFPSQSEKVAKDIKLILLVIKRQGKEVFERISHPIRATSSEKSHREAWEYLERAGIIVKANKSCRFTGAPMYRIAK